MTSVPNDGAVRLALFYATPKLSRTFGSLARSGAISLLAFDVARSSREDWSMGPRPDALVLEQVGGAPVEPALMTWLKKAHPTVPILTFGPPGKRENRIMESCFHLTEVPSAEGIRLLVADARRHHQAAEKAARVSRRLRETSKRLQILGEIVSAANSSLEPERVVSAIMAQIQKLIPSEAWSILLVDEERKELSFEMALGEKGQQFCDIRLKLGEGIAGWVAKNGKPTIVNDVHRDPRFQKRFDDLTNFIPRSILWAPCVSRGRTIGVVEIVNREAGGFTRRDLKLLLTLVEPAAIALENAFLFQKSQRLAITDDLTKLFNSRYLNTYLEKEIGRATREGSPLALIFLDLDGFKSVNDRYGHLCGSRTLFEAGRVIKQAAEGEELVSRYGGDEFVVVLPTADASAAVSTGQRIRQALKNHRFLSDRGLSIRISASLGIACFPEHGSTPQDLIQKADQAMYSVKEKGKDAVEMAE